MLSLAEQAVERVNTQKLKDNTNMSPDLRQQVNALEFDSLDDASLLTLTEVEDRLCMIESLAVQRSQRARGHGGTGTPAPPVTCHNCGKLGHLANVCHSAKKLTAQHAHHANATGSQTPNKHKKSLQCFMCGGNHHLRDCKKCDDTEKERLHREKLGPRKPSTKQASQAQVVPKPPTPPASIATAATSSNEQANTANVVNVGRPSPRGMRWASANVAMVHDDSSDETLMLPLSFTVGGAPFICDTVRPESGPMSSKPKFDNTFNCTFRKKTPTDAPKMKTRCNNCAKSFWFEDST
jgi:hypothetical protein